MGKSAHRAPYRKLPGSGPGDKPGRKVPNAGNAWRDKHMVGPRRERPMPKLVDGETALSFAEATSPKVLAMYGGEVKSAEPGALVLSFPNMHAAASWATMSELSHLVWLDRMYAGFDSAVTVDVMDPES